MASKGEIIVGLDIGTTKVVALVGEIKDNGKVEVIGCGTHVSKGMQNGVITDIGATVDSIREAVQEAELMAGVAISQVFAGIAGQHIRGFNSHGIVKVEGKEITEEDVERVVDQANAVAIPINQKVLHTIVQDYVVDGQEGIKYPIGMSAIRLEAKVHIVTGAISAAENVVRCCNKAGLSVAELVLEPLASSLAVLSEDERELGVALIDIGGGTSDLIIYLKGNVVHTSVLPLGGDLITHDIAVGLGTPMAGAEKLKQECGYAMAHMVEKTESINVPTVGSGEVKQMSQQVLCDIIEARAEEIITLINKEIRKTGVEELLGAGVVLTGGVTNLPGLARLAEELMDMRVRCAAPIEVAGLIDLVRNPIYASSVGLLQYAVKHAQNYPGSGVSVMGRIKNKLKNWWDTFV